jgi:hypothetical protein
MFDLKDEVREWCRSALPDGCGDDQLAELEDHLHCEIERLQGEGLDQAAAFDRATKRLGEAKTIMNEYSKNQSFAARLCALDRRLSGAENIRNPAVRKLAGRLVLGHSILWAVAMLATALLTRGADNAGYLVTVVFVPLWFASYMLINTTLKSVDDRPA